MNKLIGYWAKPKKIKKLLHGSRLGDMAEDASRELNALFSELRRVGLSTGRSLVRSLPLRQRLKAMRALRSFSRGSAKLMRIMK